MLVLQVSQLLKLLILFLTLLTNGPFLFVKHDLHVVQLQGKLFVWLHLSFILLFQLLGCSRLALELVSSLKLCLFSFLKLILLGFISSCKSSNLDIGSRKLCRELLVLRYKADVYQMLLIKVGLQSLNFFISLWQCAHHVLVFHWLLFGLPLKSRDGFLILFMLLLSLFDAKAELVFPALSLFSLICEFILTLDKLILQILGLIFQTNHISSSDACHGCHMKVPWLIRSRLLSDLLWIFLEENVGELLICMVFHILSGFSTSVILTLTAHGLILLVRISSIQWFLELPLLNRLRSVRRLPELLAFDWIAYIILLSNHLFCTIWRLWRLYGLQLERSDVDQTEWVFGHWWEVFFIFLERLILHDWFRQCGLSWILQLDGISNFRRKVIFAKLFDLYVRWKLLIEVFIEIFIVKMFLYLSPDIVSAIDTAIQLLACRFWWFVRAVDLVPIWCLL